LIEEKTYYLVDTNFDGQIGTLCNPVTKEKTIITIKDGKLYLDASMYGKWSFLYNPTVE